MSSSQISVAMDRWLRDRLRSAADRRRMTVSELARVLIRDGLDRPHEQQVVLNREAMEEILVTLFDTEEIVVRTYMEQCRPQRPDEKTRRKIVEAAEDRARAKFEKLLGPKVES